jgi:biopolymer transport protein TolR
MEQGFDVNLPEVENAPGMAADQEPLVVTVGRDGAIALGRSRVEVPTKLTPVLIQVLKERKDRKVLLEADRDVPYGRVVEVMAAIRAAGVDKLGMVSQPPQD